MLETVSILAYQGSKRTASPNGDTILDLHIATFRTLEHNFQRSIALR